MAKAKIPAGFKWAGSPDQAKDQLYGVLKRNIEEGASSPEHAFANTGFFDKWWNELGRMTIGDNAIDVELYAGQDVASACHALYCLAYSTGKVVTSSFNNVKIVMVDRGNYYG